MKATFNKIVLIWVCMLSCNAWACSCEEEATIAQSVATLPIILSGRILSKTVTQNYDSLGAKAVDSTSNHPWFTARNVFYKVKVERILKGKLYSDTVTIITHFGSAACEVQFSIGEKYIIYTYIDEDFFFTKGSKTSPHDTRTLWTNTCIRNTPWYEYAKEEEEYIIKEVKALNAPQKPVKKK